MKFNRHEPISKEELDILSEYANEFGFELDELVRRYTGVGRVPKDL